MHLALAVMAGRVVLPGFFTTSCVAYGLLGTKNEFNFENKNLSTLTFVSYGEFGACERTPRAKPPPPKTT